MKRKRRPDHIGKGDSSERWVRRFLTNIDWDKVEDADSCWEWKSCNTGGRKGRRYGKFRSFVDDGTIDGMTVKYAHHYAYYRFVSFVEPKPDEEFDHKCKNTKCVNPLHIRILARKINRDTGNAAKFQRSKTRCPKKHKYTEKNTYVYNGQRYCRKCCRLKNKDYHKNKKVRERARVS